MIQGHPDVFRRGLLGRAVVKGDIVALGGAQRRRKTLTGSPFEDIFDVFEQGFMGTLGFSGLKFIVAGIAPKDSPVIITETTEISVSSKAMEVTEERVPEVTYEDIGGLEDEIKKVREMVELPLKHPEIFERLGIEAPKGVLLHGPPGTGKTLLAKAVANESDANFLLINGPEVTCVVGETEVLTNPSGRITVQQLFEQAKLGGETVRSDEFKEIVIPKKSIKLYSLDNNLKIIPNEVEAISRSYAPETYKVITKNNGKHVVSRNHPFATSIKNNKIAWKTAKELKLGDSIIITSDSDLSKGNSKIKQDEILTIEKGEGATVYDISMKDYPNFFAGSPLTLVSNSKFYGESEKRIREIFDEAEKNAPSIIFIDEIDSIAPKREETYGEVERRMVAQLLATMDGMKGRGKVIVIGATNRPNSLDPALRRPGRFDREITIGVPNKAGRLNILKIHTRNMPLTKDVDIDHLASITHGFVGADLSALCKEAAMSVLRRVLPDLKLKENTSIPREALEKLRVTANDFKDALKVVRPSALREVLIENPNIKWEDIGGLAILKQELIEAVEWPLKNPNAFKRLGIRPPRGVLIYGPPGTGKTLLAKAVATESESNFIYIKGPELISKWVGESEKAIRKVFEKARQASPAIIFFDEIDSIASKRGTEIGTKSTERVLNQLLTEMDGLEELNDVVVIAATNRPDLVDSALLRPGRFDRIISTRVPNKEDRIAILKVHTKAMPLAKDVKIEELANLTENFSGADIESLCREAAILALREDIEAKQIKMKHFENALKKVSSSLTEKEIQRYQEIEESYLKRARAPVIRTPTYMG